MITLNFNFDITPSFLSGVLLGLLVGIGMASAVMYAHMGVLPWGFVPATMAYSAGFVAKLYRYQNGGSRRLDYLIAIIGISSLLGSVIAALSDDFERMVVWLPINTANGILIFADAKFWSTMRTGPTA